MDVKLRATLLDLIFGARFLKYRCLARDFSTEEDENLSFSCRWLSVVQNRSCSEIYNDVGSSRCRPTSACYPFCMCIIDFDPSQSIGKDRLRLHASCKFFNSMVFDPASHKLYNIYAGLAHLNMVEVYVFAGEQAGENETRAHL